MGYMNSGAGVLVLSKNTQKSGVGTLVPLSCIVDNGTEVPTPSKKQNGVGVLTPSLHDKHETEVSTPREKNDETAPKGIHFDRVPTPNNLFEIGSYL
jgi:hypothetical protein